MTFVITPRKIILFLSLIILSCTLSNSKNVLKKNAALTNNYNQDSLKKYYEIGLDLSTFGEDQKKCWNYVWGAGYKNYKAFFEKFWTTNVEQFIKSPSQYTMDLNTHLHNLIDENIKNEVLIDEKSNPVTCQTYLNSKRKQNITPEEIKKGAMSAFNIIIPSKPAGSKLFVTSSITTHRDIVPNKDIFKVLNGNKNP